MAILPVSSAVLNNNNMVSFNGRKKKQSSEESAPRSNKVSSLATVPVVVLMAMSPAMLNGKQSLAIMPDNTLNLTEVPADNTKNVDATYENFQVQQNKDKLKDMVIGDPLYSRPITIEGKKYTLCYAGKDEKKDGSGTKKYVEDVYFIPEGYKQQIKDRYDRLNEPNTLEYLIYHDLGEDKEFVGAAVVSIECDPDGTNRRVVRQELRLADDDANQLIRLRVGKTEFTASKVDLDHTWRRIPSFEFKQVTTPNLMEKTVRYLDD